MITVVTGIPRSGTSLMMRMLYVGGIPAHCDNHASFEHDDTLLLPTVHSWLDKCEEKAVKVLDPHRHLLPRNHEYRFIWMSRDPKEQAKSQIKLLTTIFPSLGMDKSYIKRCAQSIVRDTGECLRLLRRYEGKVLEMKFRSLLKYPIAASRDICEFLGKNLDVEKMAAVVKQRNEKCLPSLMELEELEKEMRR